MTRVSLRAIKKKGTGKSTLVMVHLTDPKRENTMLDTFEEEEGKVDPETRAWALWESIQDDWTVYGAAVISNDRAKYLGWQARMDAMGIGGTPEEYAVL